MSRVKSGLVKKVACAFVITALAMPMTVSGHAASDENLYFGALEESLAQNVKTTVVEKGEFYITGAVQATLDFTSNQWVTSSIREGTVHFQEFLVGQGDIVKKGDPIAEISVTIDEIEKEEVELNLEAAKKNLEEYISDTRILLDQYKATSQQGSERDRRLATLSYEKLLKSFKAELEKREEKIDSYTLRLDEIENLSNTKYIKAPTDGIIGYMGRLRRGEVLTGWSFLCVINDPSKVRVVVEGGSELLRYNMPVKVVQSSGNRTVELTGRVLTLKNTSISVNLMANNDIIEVYGDTSTLMPGREVSVKFDKIYVPDALMVSKNAIKSDKKGSYVDVFINGFSSKRYVVVGGSSADKSWIVSGVNEGDIIILK